MNSKTKFIILFAIVIGLIVTLLCFGPVKINIFKLSENSMLAKVFWNIRLPKTITAILAGSSLAICGLLMQTYFQNPLAGPFVLGISSGASLGVAFFILGASFIGGFSQFGVVFASLIGSGAMLFALLVISFKVPGKVVLLVLGLLFGYLASGIINILVSLSSGREIKSFLMWTLGSFQRVDSTQMPVFSILLFLGISITCCFPKQLNALLLGDQHAQALGVNLKRLKVNLILITALLSGTVTAYCGPIAFIGIIVPHWCRSLFGTSDHKILLPAVILLGALTALFAEFIASLTTTSTLPINAILGLLGTPGLVIILTRKNKELI